MVSFIFVARIRILHYMHVNHLRALWMFNSHVLEKPLHSAWRIRLVKSTCRYTSSSFQNWILWFLCAFFLLFFYVKRKIHSCVSGKRGWDAAWIWKTIQKFNFSIGWLLLANRSNARTQKSTLKNIKIFLLFIHLKVPKMRIEIENSKYEKKNVLFGMCACVPSIMLFSCSISFNEFYRHFSLKYKSMCLLLVLFYFRKEWKKDFRNIQKNYSIIFSMIQLMKKRHSMTKSIIFNITVPK